MECRCCDGASGEYICVEGFCLPCRKIFSRVLFVLVADGCAHEWIARNPDAETSNQIANIAFDMVNTIESMVSCFGYSTVVEWLTRWMQARRFQSVDADVVTALMRHYSETADA